MLRTNLSRLNNFSYDQQQGFTLLELLVVLSIGGILLSVAFAPFSDIITAQRLKVQANDTLGAILYAKSEAVTRRDFVSVCAKRNQSTDLCGSNPSNWKYGWIVFEDPDADGVVDVNEAVLRSSGEYDPLTTSGQVTVFTFDEEGIANSSGDIEFCWSEATGNKMRRLAMTPAGQPAISSHQNCG